MVDNYTLSLHDALPIYHRAPFCRTREREHRERERATGGRHRQSRARARRSEEHTSALQSPCNIVCRRLREKKNKYKVKIRITRQAYISAARRIDVYDRV